MPLKQNYTLSSVAPTQSPTFATTLLKVRQSSLLFNILANGLGAGVPSRAYKITITPERMLDPEMPQQQVSPP